MKRGLLLGLVAVAGVACGNTGGPGSGSGSGGASSTGGASGTGGTPGTGGAPGTGGVSGSGGSDGGVASCNVTSDCPPNPGASCAQVCSDGSNPCTFACVSHQCVARGCPGDGGVASPHAEGESCDDGQGCTTGLVCKAIGDPCPTYPNCKVCYLPCQTGGICPNNRICFPPSGQGGDVCLK